MISWCKCFSTRPLVRSTVTPPLTQRDSDEATPLTRRLKSRFCTVMWQKHVRAGGALRGNEVLSFLVEHPDESETEHLSENEWINGVNMFSALRWAQRDFINRSTVWPFSIFDPQTSLNTYCTEINFISKLSSYFTQSFLFLCPKRRFIYLTAVVPSRFLH